MPLDPSYNDLNRASTERIKKLAASLTDEEMQTRVGEHWTVAIALAHLAWWDRRVMYVLDRSAQDGKLFIPEIDIFVNDLSLPLWAAIPPREAARIAIETSADLDARLEIYSPNLLEEIYNYNKRWVVRALHRNEHLDEVDAALKSK
jgi:hypothetical protein